MKEKFEKMKEKAKEFWKKNKVKILIGLTTLGTTVAGGAILFALSQNRSTDISEESSSTPKFRFPKNLEHPNWGDEYDICGFIQENPDTKVLMAYMPANALCGSDFGDKFLYDCDCNPDLNAYVLVEYDSDYLSRKNYTDLYFN